MNLFIAKNLKSGPYVIAFCKNYKKWILLYSKNSKKVHLFNRLVNVEILGPLHCINILKYGLFLIT